jgi:hypothetical protein
MERVIPSGRFVPRESEKRESRDLHLLFSGELPVSTPPPA